MNELGVIYRRTDGRGRRGRGGRRATRRRTARATPSWSAPRGRSTAASSGSARRISSGCWPWPRAWAWASTTWASAGTAGPPRSTSATSSSGSTAARTARSPRGPASPSRTGPPPASGRSSRTACCTSRRPGCPQLRGRLLHLAQPRRGPARRAHDGRARRRLLRPRASTATKFFQGAHEVLDAIAVFWDGLEDDRRRGVTESRPAATQRSRRGGTAHVHRRRCRCRRIDHVRFFVGNARQSAYFYRNAFGFDVVAYAGLETGVRHEAGYVLRQGEITFVLDLAAAADHPDAARLVAHGDGVQDDRAGGRRRRRGLRGRRGPGRGRPSTPPTRHGGRARRLRVRRRSAPTATRRTRFVNRDRYHGVFAPGFKPLDPDRYSPRTFHPVGLKAIDHIVANVEEGKMQRVGRLLRARSSASRSWSSFDDKDISTEYSALMSKVVAGRPRAGSSSRSTSRRRAGGGRRSRSSSSSTAGRASSTSRWRPTTSSRPSAPWRANDVSFLKVPPAYYEMLPGPRRPDRRGPARAGRAGHPGRSRRGGLPAPDLHQARRGPADALLRDHPAPRGPELRQGELQGPLRGHRARAGAARDALTDGRDPTSREDRRMRRPCPRSPASATSTPSSSTSRPAGGSAGSTWCPSGTRCRSSTSRTRPA